MKFKEPEIVRALQTYFRSDQVEHLRRFLESLLEHSIRMNREKHEGKIGTSVFLPCSEILHVFKRKARKTLRTSKRGGNTTTVLESVDPTKPSQLATVAPWEREAVREVFEGPWAAEAELIDRFKKERPLDRNYKDYGEKISMIFEQQWSQKQKVLKATKHRLEAYPGNRQDPLYKKLNWVRDSLSSLARLDEVSREGLKDFNPYDLFSGVRATTKEGFTTSLYGLHKSGELGIIFPEVEKLFSAWEEIRAPGLSSMDSH
jgi:hypothetical protein